MSSLDIIKQEFLRDMDLLPRHQARVWQKVMPTFREALSTYGENLLLCAIAACEIQGKMGVEDILAEAKRQYAAREDVRVANPDEYDEMQRNAADITQGWLIEYRRLLRQYLRGSVRVEQYTVALETILRKHSKLSSTPIHSSRAADYKPLLTDKEALHDLVAYAVMPAKEVAR